MTNRMRRFHPWENGTDQDGCTGRTMARTGGWWASQTIGGIRSGTTSVPLAHHV
jgi:hypothetical protein